MKSPSECTVQQNLRVVEAQLCDYEQLARFHYRPGIIGPIRGLYKVIDCHPWRSLAAPVVGVIVYGAPPANLAARNRATGGLFCGVDRSAGLSLLNAWMICIRRVIIEPRYRGLGLGSWLVRQTLERTGSPMVEAISMMGRTHPFLERAGMKAFEPAPDAKTERITAAFETAGIPCSSFKDPLSIHASIEALPKHVHRFLLNEMQRFCEKFTNRRRMPHGIQRTDFILSKLTVRPVYYLWTNPRYRTIF